ncbi:hypothetical protein PAHAL_2G165900 [Panicum hallii]|uniref:Uncharacterized protein n=1 Tax=Panicum hallii TaxID=206008 RepID=A0A2S3GY98_9POAL|nr:hypothetical protein PAHAL_2G165900 [Panicum hallii]
MTESGNGGARRASSGHRVHDARGPARALALQRPQATGPCPCPDASCYRHPAGSPHHRVLPRRSRRPRVCPAGRRVGLLPSFPSCVHAAETTHDVSITRMCF